MEFTSAAFNSLLGRNKRSPPKTPWHTIPQPVPLVTVKSVPIANTKSVRYVATSISPEASTILSQLPAPLYIIAFVGLGRTGKSYTATRIRRSMTGTKDHGFTSQPGNVPCTHGIDMMGSGNHNQSAIPFVMGLAARLSSRMYVFERGCFTTAGLDTVMQVVNMGQATSTQDVDMTRSLVFVENMSFNQDMSVRSLVKERFDVEFVKLPYNDGGEAVLFGEACDDAARILGARKTPFMVGGVPVDGTAVAQLVNEAVAVYNMVSATEAMVANMASEAANSVWSTLLDKLKRTQNLPSQITGRKPLRNILREIHLHPAEPALVAKSTWERNLKGFVEDVKSAHARRGRR
ncbi:hypothetical protein BC829DRAFT_447462 [Chytridium lagenaria]|nr:hypothetical protein BC829DRAFT_447462 [Chytridium lagenaria]